MLKGRVVEIVKIFNAGVGVIGMFRGGGAVGKMPYA